MVEVYTDGSYNRNIPDVTKGAVVVLVDGKPVFAQRYIIKQPELVKSWNVGGELFSAIAGIQIANEFVRISKSRALTIYYDYKGIREFIQGTPVWKPKTDSSRLYVSLVQAFMNQNPNAHINFVKVKSHTGNKWNEVVDDLTRGDVDPEIVLCYKGEVTV